MNRLALLPRTSCLSLASAAWIAMALAAAHTSAQPSPHGGEEKVAVDTAILKITAPKDTKVVVNGKEYGAKLDFSFPGMEPGRLYRYEIQAVLPDGRQVARSVLLHGGWRVELPLEESTAARPELVPQTGHAGVVLAVACSPDGRYILTGSDDSTAIVWDAKTGRQLRTLRGHRSSIRAVAFSPDGDRAVTGSWDGRAILWKPRTGEVVRTFQASDRTSVWSVAISPDGRRLLTDEVVWDLGTGQRIHDLPKGEGFVGAAAFSPDGRFMATGGFKPNFLVKLWDAKTARELHSLAGHKKEINSLAFSPDGRTLVSASEDSIILFWDTNSGKQIRTLDAYTSPVNSVAFSPDGRYLLSGSYAQGAILWDASNGEKTKVSMDHLPTTIVGTKMVHAVGFSPDGRQAVTGANNSAIVWEVAKGRQINVLRGATSSVGIATFDDEGLHLQTGRKLPVVNDSTGNRPVLARSPDSRWALVGSYGPDVCLWETSTGKQKDLAGHTGATMTAAFSPDGQYAITGSWDQSAIVWKVSNGAKLQALKTTSGVSAVALSRDGKRALCGQGDGIVSLWDVTTGRQLAKLKGFPDMISSVAFSPNERYLIAGSYDNRISVWEADSGRLMQTFDGHTSTIQSARLSRDNRYLASASMDGTERLWDVATGKELVTLLGLNYGKDWLAITPEGLFDGSRLGREMVSFRFGGELQVVPVDRFFQDFYRPGLLHEIWHGVRPAPEVQLGGAKPPVIRVVAPENNRDFTTQRMTLEVEVADQGGGILGPWLLQNGARVIVPGSTEKKGSTIRRTFDVNLTGGENHFEIRAASGDGAWESEPTALVARCEQSLPKPELHLLVVGINRYDDRSLDLAFPRRDAESLAGLFRLRGSDLYGGIHVASLTDQEATREAILVKLHEVAAATRPQDTLIAYFSGHGVMAGTQYYFLPHEIKVGGDTPANDARRQGLAAADVGEVLAQATALKRVLLFDTGQSGGRLFAAHTARNPFAFRGAIEELGRMEGAFTLAAAPTSDRAHEVPELGHGVLTYALLAGLHAVDKGPLAGQWIQPETGDRVAGVLDWFGFAARNVPELSVKYFAARQEVQHASAGSNFPVLSLPGGVAVPQAVVASRTTPQPPNGRETANKPTRVPSGDLPAAHLIAVGINSYRNAALNLQFAVPDAKAISELFQQRAAPVYGDVKPHLVTDEKATHEGIRAAIKSVATLAQAQDLVVLYLAGHGVMVGQRYYFLPHDFQQRSDRIEEDIRAQGIPGDELADMLAEVAAMKQILILDTCASGATVQLGSALRDPVAFRSFVDRLGRRQGVFTLAATAAGDEAHEVPELGHGVLTYALLAALRAAPPGPLDGKFLRSADARGQVDVLDWFSYATGHVPRLTKRFLGKEQYVQTGGQGRSFPVLPIGP